MKHYYYLSILVGLFLCLPSKIYSQTITYINPLSIIKPDAAPSDIQFDLVREKNTFFYKGKQLTQAEYKKLLETCPIALADYENATVLIKSGWSTLGIGLGLTAIGVVCDISRSKNMIAAHSLEVFSEESDEYFRIANSRLAAEIPLLIIGGCLTILGIPLLSVGYTRRNRTIDTFNQQCAEPNIIYNLTVGQNGLGLAINF